MRKEVKVLLFRKLFWPASQSQQEVSDAAVAEMMDQTFNSELGPVIICDERTPSASKDTENMVNRILGALFKSVYSLQSKKELYVTIIHSGLSGGTDNCLRHFNGCPENPSTNDHFVAAPGDVHAYMLNMMSSGKERHYAFTIHVRQSRKCCGTLHFLMLRKLAKSTSLGLPLGNLFNILEALECSSKTHMEYHNVQLTRVLKQLMGDSKRTVMINYSYESLYRERNLEDWKSMYIQERLKYNSLKRKVLDSTVEKEEMEEYLANLESSDSFEDQPEDNKVNQDDQKKELQIEESKDKDELQSELEHIELASKASIVSLQKLQLNIQQLKEAHSAQELQLTEKNWELATTSTKLCQTREELKEQKFFFQKKLSEYLNTVNGLWRQQISKIQQQEQQQRKQLSDTFDEICRELQAAQERTTPKNPDDKPGGSRE